MSRLKSSRRATHERRTGHARRVLVLACALSASSIAIFSQAQPSPQSSRLVWARGPDTDTCPTRDELMKSVASRLHYNPFTEHATRIIAGSVTHTRGRYVIVLQLLDGSESFPARHFESSIDDCSAVAQAAALSIAVDIEAAVESSSDAGGATEAGELDSSTVALASRPSTAADGGTGHMREAAARRAERSPPPLAPRGASVSVGVAVAAGLLPRLAAGIEVAGVLRFEGPLSLSVGMSHFPEIESDDPNFSLGSTLVRLGVCYAVLRWRSGGLAGCGHLRFGSTTLVVETLQPIEPGSTFFFAPALGGGLAQSLGPLTLQLGLDAHTPLPRYEFAIAGTNRTIFTAPVVAAIAYAGIGMGF